MESKLSDFGKSSCGIPQRSIAVSLLFLTYVNDMLQVVKSTLHLHADDSCILYQHKEINEIKNELTEDFEDISDWFVDNKLSTHFGEDKTKSILFASKRRSKNFRQLNIYITRYKHINIKQYSQVTYLGCVLDETMLDEPMALGYKHNKW